MTVKSKIVDSVTALELWNSGKSLRQIAACFPGASRSAVQWAIERAVNHGLGEARHRCVKPEPPEPPLVALWASEGE